MHRVDERLAVRLMAQVIRGRRMSRDAWLLLMPAALANSRTGEGFRIGRLLSVTVFEDSRDGVRRVG